MKKKRVFEMMTAAGCALFAASAMGAATVVSNDFETATGPLVEGDGWTGYGTITATSYVGAADSTVGRPIAGGDNVLAIEGRATRTAATTANNAATVDMMVQIALPDDGLAFPSGTTTDNIQIAVGVDTNATANTGDLKVYCKNRSNVVGWYSLGQTLAKDSWHRVSFTFDYANQLCQIRVDGDPAITANGILKAGSNQDGGWYKLATSTEKTALAEVQIIGSTSIDDLLVSDAATVNDALPAMADASTPKTVDGVAIDKTWIEKQGITRAQADGNALDYATTGMTVAQKYAAGYDVDDGKKFELKDMTLSGNNAVVKFNEANIPSGYKYVIDVADNASFTSATTQEVSGQTSGEATIPMSGNVKYYRIRLTNAE